MGKSRVLCFFLSHGVDLRAADPPPITATTTATASHFLRSLRLKCVP